MLKKFLFSLIILTSCTVGPTYNRPEFPIESDKNYFNKVKKSRKKFKNWWESLKDPILEDWVKELYSNNYSLKAASERILQAKEGIIAERGALYPSLDLNGSAGRTKTIIQSFGGLGQAIGAGEGLENSPIQRPPDAFYNNSFNLKLATSWQLDLFGKIRNGIDAQESNFLATQTDKIALQQTLISELLRKRVSIGSLEKQLELSKRIISTRQKTRDSIKSRYELGAASVSALDFRLAEESLNTAMADIKPVETALEIAKYSVDLLLGNAPGELISQDKKIFNLPAPEEILIPQPLELMDRRPDLISHEFRIMAANSDLGVSIADLYPGIVIGADYGFQSLDINELIKPERIVWSIIGSIGTKLFQGGRLRANIRAKEARVRELSANYTDAILKALFEVESALLNEKKLRAEFKKLKVSLEAMQAAEVMAFNRYSNGLITIFELLDIQRRSSAMEQRYLNTELSIWNARVDLYLALGGNWLLVKEEKNESN